MFILNRFSKQLPGVPVKVVIPDVVQVDRPTRAPSPIAPMGSAPTTPAPEATIKNEPMSALLGRMFEHVGKGRLDLGAEVAVSSLISEVSQHTRVDGVYKGWSLALNSPSVEANMRALLRGNPGLRARLHRTAKNHAPTADALRVFRNHDIGVEVTAKPFHLKPGDEQQAVAAVRDLMVGRCFEHVLNDVHNMSRAGVLVKPERKPGTDLALISLGEALVREHDAIDQRAARCPALRKLVHSICAEEPLVSKGMRIGIARQGESPQFKSMMESLGLGVNPETCQFEPVQIASPVRSLSLA